MTRNPRAPRPNREIAREAKRMERKEAIIGLIYWTSIWTILFIATMVFAPGILAAAMFICTILLTSTLVIAAILFVIGGFNWNEHEAWRYPHLYIDFLNLGLFIRIGTPFEMILNFIILVMPILAILRIYSYMFPS